MATLLPAGNDAQSKKLRIVTIAFWAVEAVALVFAIVTLALTGSAADGFKHGIGVPSMPTKLSYNIAIAALTMIVLLVVLPLDILSSKLPFWAKLNKAYAPWPRLVITLVLTFFWVGCVASSVYSCSDLCSTGNGFLTFIDYAGKCCSCDGSGYDGCNSRKSQYYYGYDPYYSFRYFDTKPTFYVENQALDAVMLVLFIATCCLVLSFRWLLPSSAPVTSNAPTQPQQEMCMWGSGPNANAGGMIEMSQPQMKQEVPSNTADLTSREYETHTTTVE